MKSALDITEQQLSLLTTLELEEVCATVAGIITTFAKPQAVAILVWDPDFESFSEDHRYAFGPESEQLLKLLKEFCSEDCNWDFGGGKVREAKASDFGGDAQDKLDPIYFYKVENDGEPVAMLFVAGDADVRIIELEAHLAQFAILQAIANTHEVAELRREVERVRDQYEQLEAEYVEIKRQLSESSGNNVFRMEQSDKEKLVYEISNAVRSSLDIQEVLQTAVNKIGLTFSLSRCLVIWPMPDSQDYSVYEYFDERVPPAKEVFYTPQGELFVKTVSKKTAPHDFCDGEQDQFDDNFLRCFGFLSGMLMPLIYHNRNIGSLFLQDCMGAREWSIDNTALIGSLADLVTVAIEHANMHEEKKKQAVTDGLTGISNRRHFNDTLEKEFERARRYDKTLSLVVVDLDFLKKINDNYGHQAGDQAIKSIGGVLARSCRSVDTAARYGGEEFCLLLPDTETEDAVLLAERVRKRIAETFIEGPGNISASLGVATYPSHASDPDELFQAADHALYQAKESGRNRVCIASAASAEIPAKADKSEDLP